MLSQHHHHNHHHNKTTIRTSIFRPQLNLRYRLHILEKVTRRIRHILARPLGQERSPPVCAWRTSTSSEHHSTIRTRTHLYYCYCDSCSPFTHDVTSLSPPCAPLPPPRIGSPQSRQWPQHRLQRRSARRLLLHLCTVHCTTHTSHTPLAVRSAAPRRAILTPQLTLTAHQRRTFNARPPHQRPAREHASPTHISPPHLRHQLHLSDTLSCTRRLARHLPAVHWPTCSAILTILHNATCLRHFLCYQPQARLRKSATPHL